MAQTYTFLFVTVEAVGHFNACIGIAQKLHERGHRVVFATPNSWKGKLETHGFIEEIYQTSKPVQQPGEKNPWERLMEKLGPTTRLPPIERFEYFQLEMYEQVFADIKSHHQAFLEMVDRVKPNVVVADFTLHVPALMNNSVPWVLSCSCNPLSVSDTGVAPAFSGYPTTGNEEESQRYRDKAKSVYSNFFPKFQNWVAESGGPQELEYTHPFFIQHSPWANIYMYPEELDYTSLRPNPPNWHRFDAFVRSVEESFEIPEKLRDGPGKLVYFSLGSVGSNDTDLMKRLLKILAKSPNRFIVSKGPHGDELELADNMWGMNSVPQTRVIPLVDLVMTHGGNNTVTECFYFGKRLLVLGMLWDQLDNAQRVHETGHGLRCHPYEVTEEELLASIEQLLKDDLLERRMTSIGKRIQASNSQSAAADLIESIAINNRVPEMTKKN